ncbi:hypothetical protein [Natronoglycomyces albus]|uniref:Uncharacterized protein n=1 Tax=Natronoglycomyces albus TaxID=2811108 RepID=A0A895XS91_9ACTN|nr:hypothetical protein [Natronoglycomyces albus]QSB05130.1 hypothetical protein JQS30_15435 [Natronoglycomyces albus]
MASLKEHKEFNRERLWSEFSDLGQALAELKYIDEMVAFDGPRIQAPNNTAAIDSMRSSGVSSPVNIGAPRGSLTLSESPVDPDILNMKLEIGDAQSVQIKKELLLYNMFTPDGLEYSQFDLNSVKKMIADQVMSAADSAAQWASDNLAFIKPALDEIAFRNPASIQAEHHMLSQAGSQYAALMEDMQNSQSYISDWVGTARTDFQENMLTPFPKAMVHQSDAIYELMAFLELFNNIVVDSQDTAFNCVVVCKNKALQAIQGRANQMQQELEQRRDRVMNVVFGFLGPFGGSIASMIARRGDDFKIDVARSTYSDVFDSVSEVYPDPEELPIYGGTATGIMNDFATAVTASQRFYYEALDATKDGIQEGEDTIHELRRNAPARGIGSIVVARPLLVDSPIDSSSLRHSSGLSS